MIRAAGSFPVVRPAARADGTVRCNLDGATLYTTRRNAMIAEYAAMNTGSGTVSRPQAGHRYLAQKMPGKSRPEYLNLCDEMASMLPRYRF
ncbi:hypothetical protein [Bradyrhizobium sp. BR 1433]|uniref:hypothetical protein n=1 Tax=Bradyrhizobium sp. BR 1433 TaxID=3447967 RepID=UPI003EE81432